MNKRLILSSFCFLFTLNCFAKTTVKMNFTTNDGAGETAGTVVISESPYGLIFTPNLQGLSPGIHGFHVHENPACEKDGMAAGGHFDPLKTGKHLGPYNTGGHEGDLPVIVVDADGTATLPVLAPRLHDIKQISQHALMIHHAGDNYSDAPEKLGGGGARMACGIITSN